MTCYLLTSWQIGTRIFYKNNEISWLSIRQKEETIMLKVDMLSASAKRKYYSIVAEQSLREEEENFKQLISNVDESAVNDWKKMLYSIKNKLDSLKSMEKHPY